jgi:hypothetical protein
MSTYPYYSYSGSEIVDSGMGIELLADSGQKIAGVNAGRSDVFLSLPMKTSGGEYAPFSLKPAWKSDENIGFYIGVKT